MNIFKQLFKSLYSPKDIALFRFQGIGKTILYVFLLTLISIIPSVYYFSMAITRGVDAATETIQNEIPSFSIKNGQLQSDTKIPVTINKNGFTIIFDSSGTIEQKDLQDTENAAALLKNELVFIAGGEIQAYSYSMVNDLKVTKNDVVEFLKSMDSALVILVPILFIVIYIFSSAMKFIEITILAFLALFLKNAAGKKVQYSQLWRMAAYSVTLPTIFFTIMAAIQTAVPAGFLINWFVALIVLFLAIKELPKPKQR